MTAVLLVYILPNLLHLNLHVFEELLSFLISGLYILCW